MDGFSLDSPRDPGLTTCPPIRGSSIAVDARKAVRQVAAVEEDVDDIVEETPPAAVAVLEAFIPLFFDRRVAPFHEAVER